MARLGMEATGFVIWLMHKRAKGLRSLKTEKLKSIVYESAQNFTKKKTPGKIYVVSL